MNALTFTTPTSIADMPIVIWQEAIEPFLNTLDSPQTRRGYRTAIAEAMQRLVAATIDEITGPRMLTTKRRLSPASVAPVAPVTNAMRLMLSCPLSIIMQVNCTKGLFDCDPSGPLLYLSQPAP
jgi:hypothetical protein